MPELSPIVLLPLGGFLFNLLAGPFVPRGWVSMVGCGVVAAAFGYSAVAFRHLLEHGGHIEQSLFPWGWIHLPGGGTQPKIAFDFTLWCDPLSAVMILVVSGVGFLIHVYSTGYMAEEKRYSRYFAYLNLFTSFMLLLVLAKNLLVMFIGWEGVGLCSYLLIGFWFDDRKKGLENSAAGMKAFIVNRIGDLAFTIGVLLIFLHLKTLDIPELPGKLAEGVPDWFACAVGLLLFGGATGKSAQIPLFVWLPDAMAGPTPVSALIHAATMVTAGVYMCARMGFLFTLSPVALTVVGTVGAATSLLAAIIAFSQNDIKKVLAYSTVSQLGLMFLAVGARAYWVAIFHVMTHAFFKACLFLGSGSVIHGCGGEQDIRKMGGLRKYMPITFATFLIATLAISGVPFLAGFFSKDEILWKTFSANHFALPHWNYVLWLAGLCASFGTAFYMARLFATTFLGNYRGEPAIAHSGGGVHRGEPGPVGHPTEEEHGHGHPGPPHESPWVMTLPLIVLGVLSILGGYVGVSHAIPLHLPHIESFLRPVFEGSETKGHPSGGGGRTPEHGESDHPKDSGHEENAGLEIALMFVSAAIAIGGLFAGLAFTFWKKERAEKFARDFPVLYDLSLNKFYVDEIYDRTVVRGTLAVNQACARFDNEVIDGAVNGAGNATVVTSKGVGVVDNEVVDALVNDVADVTKLAGDRIRRIQGGNIREYVAAAVAGALALIAFFSVRVHWDKFRTLFTSWFA